MNHNFVNYVSHSQTQSLFGRKIKWVCDRIFDHFTQWFMQRFQFSLAHKQREFWSSFI